IDVVRRLRSADARGLDLTLAQSPAIVLSAGAVAGLKVDLLALALPHVANPQVAGGAIEAGAERVAQPVRPDFVVAGHADKRVALRDGVVSCAVGGEVVAIDIDAQHLAEPVV